MDSSAPSFSLGTSPFLAARQLVCGTLMAWKSTPVRSSRCFTTRLKSSSCSFRRRIRRGYWWNLRYLALTSEGKRRGNICSASWPILSSLLRILTSLAFGFVCVWWTCFRIVNVRALDLNYITHVTIGCNSQDRRPSRKVAAPSLRLCLQR